MRNVICCYRRVKHEMQKKKKFTNKNPLNEKVANIWKCYIMRIKFSYWQGNK